MFLNKLTIASFTLLTVAACSPFAEPVGSNIDIASRGSSSERNTLVQARYLSSGVAFDALSQRFNNEVPTTVNFDFNRTTLTASAQSVLGQQVAWLRSHPEARLRITGHTDLVGEEGYNLGLGLRRAETVVNYMVNGGISRDRLDAVTTQGETQPVIPTPDRERLNRRSVTSVAGIAFSYAEGDFDGLVGVALYDRYVTRNANVAGDNAQE